MRIKKLPYATHVGTEILIREKKWQLKGMVSRGDFPLQNLQLNLDSSNRDNSS